MKIFQFLQIVLISSILISCITPDFSNIEGVWIAEGYNCKELTNLSQEVKIEKIENTYYAIKLTGDDCIPAGDTSWYGELKENRIVGQIKGVNPQTLDKEFFECEIFESIGFLQVAINKNVIIKMKRK